MSKACPIFPTQSAHDVLNCFLHAYFTEQNPEKALSLVTEDIFCTLPGESATVRDRSALALLMHGCIRSGSGPADCALSDYTEKLLPGGMILGLCRIDLFTAPTAGVPYSSGFRLSVGFLPENSRYLITFLHADAVPGPFGIKLDIPLFLMDKQEKLSGIALQTLLSQLAPSSVPCGILGIYLENRYPLCLISNALLHYLGYTCETLLAASNGSILSILHPVDCSLLTQSITESIRTKKDLCFRCRIRKQDGTYVWICYNAKPLSVSGGRTAMVGVAFDISETVHLKERLEQESTLDSLTQVLNRREAQRQIEHNLSAFGRGALLLLSLDHYETFLAACGRLEADELLVHFARLLKENVRSDDIIARPGENEFIVYLHSVWHREDVTLQAKRLYRVVQEFFRDYPSKPPVMLSIGGALTVRGQTFVQLYDAANKMLRQSRQAAASEEKIQIF